MDVNLQISTWSLYNCCFSTQFFSSIQKPLRVYGPVFHRSTVSIDKYGFECFPFDLFLYFSLAEAINCDENSFSASISWENSLLAGRILQADLGEVRVKRSGNRVAAPVCKVTSSTPVCKHVQLSLSMSKDDVLSKSGFLKM